MNKQGFLLILFVILGFNVQAQTWWNELHGWDSSKPNWQTFMKVSPGFLGINALPVPTQIKGEIGAKRELEFSADIHFAKGERAQNLFLRGYFPFGERISIELWGVPIEYYNHNEQIRNERISRDEDGKGWAYGDLLFSTQILLVKEKQWPSVVFRMACKTAAGVLSAARFTDTPAYWFDLSTGKNVELGSWTMRPYAMFGFYAWQTTNDLLLQDDARLFGGGVEFSTPGFSINNSIQGYSGYFDKPILAMNYNDKPINYRLNIEKEIGSNKIVMQYQHGIRHVLYESLRMGWVFSF